MTFGLLGGDARFGYLAEAASRSFDRVICFGLDSFGFHQPILQTDSLNGVCEQDILLLPLPVTKDGKTLFAPLAKKEIFLSDLAACIKPNQFVLGGKIDPAFTAVLREKGAEVTDYFKREELARQNALPTAEGALWMLMQNTVITVHKAKTLVIGYGRVGKAVADLLTRVGAEVTVAVRRREVVAELEQNGIHAILLSSLKTVMPGLDILINTVPAPVVTAEHLSLASPQLYGLDLASAPGGIDFKAAEALGIKAEPAPSLPGKIAPKTAGEILWKTVQTIIKETDYE